MIRILTGSNLTAVPSDTNPGVGFQWKLYYAVGVISVGTTAGTRSIQIGMKPDGNSIGQYLILAPINSSSLDVSGDTVVSAGGLAVQGANGTSSVYATWNTRPILNPDDTLTFNGTSLISGDKLSYWISLEEISVADGLE